MTEDESALLIAISEALLMLTQQAGYQLSAERLMRAIDRVKQEKPI